MQYVRLSIKTFIYIGLSIWLTACGGSDSSDPAVEANFSCVTGSSKLGDCKI